MSDTNRAEKAERADDERGNPVPYKFGYDPGAGDDWSSEDYMGHLYVPVVAPLREGCRNTIIRCAVEEVLRRRGHGSGGSGYRLLYDLVGWMSAEEVFDILAVLDDYDPESNFATPERTALYRALPANILGDSLLAELAGDALLCMGVGEDPAWAEHFLEDEGEWTEFRVSLRVALQVLP